MNSFFTPSNQYYRESKKGRSIVFNKEYLPIYLTSPISGHICNSLLYPSEIPEEELYIYSIPYVSYITLKNYTQLLNSFYNSTGLDGYIFIKDDTTRKINVSKGLILDKQGNILLLMTAKKYEPYLSDSGKFKIENMRLYVGFDFVKNDVYSNIYKQVYKRFIDKCFELKIPVIFESSEIITKKYFDYEIKKSFQTVEEMNTHLKKDVFNLLLETTTKFEEDTSSQTI